MAVVWLAGQSTGVIDGGVVEQAVAWVPQLGLTIDLRLDGFGLLFALLVSGIGVLVLAYATRYFAPHGAHGEPAGMGRLAGLVVLFAGAMLGVVLADNLLALYVCWELTTITSYLLIGWDDQQPRARAAALQALLTTGGPGLAMLGGFVLLGQQAGTYRLSELLAEPPTGTVTSVALLLVLLGAFAKSAQYPFHAWLPGAMAAPTPISTYLHSATMVKAGVYLIARFAPVFADQAGWRWWCVGLGGLTMVAGGLRALRQYDLKLLMAYSTVSQLGLLVVLFGIGLAKATLAGCAVLLAHALFKASLFMIVGIVDHQAHSRDLRALGPLGPGWGPVGVLTLVNAGSMAAVPLLFGFVAKEEAYKALYAGGIAGAGLVLAVVVGGSVLTVAYAARFVWGAFRPYDGASPDRPAPVGLVRPPAAAFVAPVAVLAVPTVVLGLVPGLADGLLGAAAQALDTAAPDAHFQLWYGLNVPLLLSALTLAAGVSLFAARRPVARFQARFAGLPSGDDGYASFLRGLNLLADRVTGVVQHGSLPAYLGVILLTVALVPSLVLLARTDRPGLPSLVDEPLHLLVAVLLVAGAIGAASVRHRLGAGLCLGIVGYGMGLLFALWGAPDLALTQFAIETLSIVLFVLVLRVLPGRFEHRPPARTLPVRLGVSVAVGAAVFAFTLAAVDARRDEPPKDDLIAAAVPEGGGRNVVNVILVDVRALDTLGEIMVLATAATGALALARAGRRSGWSDQPPEARSRSIVLDTVIRLVYPSALLFSLYLLFAGHNQPGGGFVGGLVAGAAIALRYVAGGTSEARRAVRLPSWAILGTGLVVAAVTGLLSLLTGDALLESTKRMVDVPLLGEVNLVSALVFDSGVYLVVVGLVVTVIEAFGGGPACPGEPDGAQLTEELT